MRGPARSETVMTMTLDPNQPIFRIFRLEYFEQALRSRQLVFVPPRNWHDPYEVLAELIMMTDLRATPFQQKSLEPYLCPVFAQCWSMTEESDTLLRAYSSVEIDPVSSRNKTRSLEGVKVRTTPAKIRAAVENGLAGKVGMECFVERVRYLSDSEIHQYCANRVGGEKLSELGRGRSRAEFAFLKRPAFHNEAEVRVIVVDNERTQPANDLLKVSFDPNAVFEAVTFEPRLIAFERMEREAWARKLGYGGPFVQSTLYRKVMLEIGLRDGWKD